MATASRKPIPSADINFGDLSFYTAGGGIPEGDYALTFNVQMYQAQNQQGVNKGPARLGVMVTCSPLDGGDERTQFYSMGTKAHESYAPNPQTGKGLVSVPGGPGGGPNNATNWALFLKSLYDSGLPQGIFSNDLTALDGIHVHMINVPEPVERAGFKSNTGEAASEQQGPRTIAIVSEIKDDGKPWEGTGGVPEVAAKAPNGKPAPKGQQAHARSAAASQTKSVSAQAEQSGDTYTVAVTGVSTALEKSPNGCPKLQLRVSTFKAVNESLGGTKEGQEMAQAVINEYFVSDAALNGLLGPLGYKIEGLFVKPQ